jgi:Uma2 family endonuclease
MIATSAPRLPKIQQPRMLSLTEFRRRYANRSDGYKYEWNRGIVEKTKNMDQFQTTYFAILLRRYMLTQSFADGGILTNETDMSTTKEQLRRPDIAIYSGVQLQAMRQGHTEVAAWVAEVISEFDQINKVNKKLVEYFNAGVQVVWHIFPETQSVYVYTSIDQVTICRGERICSAAPALPDFEISAAHLFS